MWLPSMYVVIMQSEYRVDYSGTRLNCDNVKTKLYILFLFVNVFESKWLPKGKDDAHLNPLLYLLYILNTFYSQSGFCRRYI
jgi:hypothetical protein